MGSGEIHNQVDPRVWQFWGKASPPSVNDALISWHPLACHLVDVVACADRVLNLRADRARALASALGLPEEAARKWIRLFVALHDLGKATPAFQAKVKERRAVLDAAGLDFPDRSEPHGSLSAPLVSATLVGLGIPPRLAGRVARAVAAHHGEFISLEALRRIRSGQGVLLPAHGGMSPDWDSLRADLVLILLEACAISDDTARPRAPDDQRVLNALMVDLAGLTTAADWLGSNAEVFTYVEPPGSVDAYVAKAKRRAMRAVDNLGWRRPPQPATRRSFKELFAKDPWPLHVTIEALAPTLEAPCLVIIEAPMGEGKTEAALALFDALASRGASGLYFALPTQATSNQILGRVERFLRDAFNAEPHGLHLVHGDAALSEDYGALKSRALSLRAVNGVAGFDEGPVADAWFARSKRALLAPVAVGTVDQALLGVLGVRHYFLRLHGLAGKVVVVDEVHAYDTYTSELLDRLVAWLGSLGATVVLLSATLPSSRRDAIIASFGASRCGPARYPRVTFARPGGNSSSIGYPARRQSVRLAVRWDTADALPDRLTLLLSQGGCAAWIVNTVRSAQQTYLRLCRLRDEGRLDPDVEISLLHARFPFDARAAREKMAEAAFGPGEATRPRAAILVGTQVLEQSLDLDFDVMVSEIAPIDLLLQRSGRLHRHSRTRQRPQAVAQPTLLIVRPDEEGSREGPRFGTSTYVYDEAVLLRTWLALRERTELALPADIETLIEEVYAGPFPQVERPFVERLARLDTAKNQAVRVERSKARAIVLRDPGDDDPFDGLAQLVDDEDPSLHGSLRAATRLGDPKVDVVPVRTDGGRVVLAAAPEISLRLEEPGTLPHATVLAVARQAVGITHRALTAALLKQSAPRAFAASAHLRHHRVVHVNETGRAIVNGVELAFDDDLGLVIGSLQQREDDT